MCYLAGDIALANGLTVALALWPRRTALPARAHTKNNSRAVSDSLSPKHTTRMRLHRALIAISAP